MSRETPDPTLTPELVISGRSCEDVAEGEWRQRLASCITGLEQKQDEITPLIQRVKSAGLLVEPPSETPNSELTSWCPGGNASGGVCRPPNNEHRARWMGAYRVTYPLPIGEMILPGTHNAGFDKEAPYTPSNEVCQDVSIYKQLEQGVRVLDLRVQYYSGNAPDNQFAIFHDSSNGRYVKSDVLDAISRFRSDKGAFGEIIVLDFHAFKNFTPEAHQKLAALLKRELRATLIPYVLKNAAQHQLVINNRINVVAYNNSARDPLFWPGVDQKWIGENTPGKDKMADFIAEVGNTPKAFGELRSVQAAYYSLPFLPRKTCRKI